VPEKVETYHLTLTTVLWCALIVFFSFLARYNIHFRLGHLSGALNRK
jgi:hypothetical protein